MNKKNRKNILNSIILIAVLSFAFYLHQNRIYKYAKSALIMDTFIEIKIETKNENDEKIIDRCFELIRELEDKFNFYDSKSMLSKINGTTNIAIDDDIHEVLSIANKIYLETDSLYDVSVGELSKLWNIDNQIIPTKMEIDNALQKTGFDKIVFDEKNMRKPKNISLNFGSIAKGFIIDKAINFLLENSVESAIVNAGGDIRIIGKKKPITIGIQHPRKKQSELIGKIHLLNKSVVTSGDYERFFEIDGERYHHLLNPKTGYPARENVSVTVIAETAILADAYSTAFFVMNSQEAVKLANKIDGVDVMIIRYDSGKLIKDYSSKMEEYLKL